MTTLLRVHPSSSSLYVADQPVADSWVGFVFPEGMTGPSWGYFPVSSAWPDISGSSLYQGFFIFSPRQPANAASFVSAVWNFIDGQPNLYQDMTMPLWIVDPDAPTLSPIYLPTTMGTSPVIPVGANMGFGGNFAFLIPANSYYACDPVAETLTITAQQNFIFNVNGFQISGFDPSLTLPLSGANAGKLMLNSTMAIDPTPSGADLGLHYNYQTASGVQQIRYPMLDIGAAGPKLSFAVALDPSAPFDHSRTQFAFQGQSIGASLPTGLLSPLGQQASLAPLAGSALVIRQLYGANTAGGGFDSAFEPHGPFSLSLPFAAPDGPLSLLPGLSGSESLSVPSQMTVTFQPGASFCPFDPTQDSDNIALPLDDMNGQAVTSWVAVGAMGAAQTVYASQPAQSAFYGTDASLADYLFCNKPLSTLTAQSLPAVPFAATGLIAQQLGTKVDIGPYQAFERHAASQVRQRILMQAAQVQRSRPLLGSGQSVTLATGRGLVVGSNDGGQTFQSVALASSTDAQKVQHNWQLSNLCAAMSTSLQSSTIFLLANRLTKNGSTLFNIDDLLAFFDWQLGVSLDGTIPGQFLLLKFGPGSVATLAGQPAAWTDADIFVDDPASLQRLLQERINTVASYATGPDKDLAALYGPLYQLLNDEAWNGVLAFSPLVDAMPAVVNGIVSALPDGQLVAFCMGLSINALSGGGGDAPSIKASAPFAVVDYELPPPTTGGAGSSGEIAAFEVDFIRARFQNGDLASFAAQATLTINSLFSMPVAKQNGAGQDSPSNAIVIVGSYQNPVDPNGQGTYSFAAASPSTFRFAYEWYQGNAKARIIDEIVIEAIQFLPVTSDEQNTVSRFAITGSFAFAQPNEQGKPQGLQIGGDLFDFNALNFVNLGLVMTDTANSLDPPTWQFDVTEASLTVNDPSTLRDGLAKDMPLSLNRLVGAGTLDQYGCQLLAVPTNWTPPIADFDYAFIFSLDLGRPGTFAASSADLTSTMILGWTADGDYALGFGINGLGQQRQLTLQGIMQLVVGEIGISPLKQGAGTRLALVLNQSQIIFLGNIFPPQGNRFDLALFGAPPYPSSRLLWFASDGQFIPPSGGGS